MQFMQHDEMQAILPTETRYHPPPPVVKYGVSDACLHPTQGYGSEHRRLWNGKLVLSLDEHADSGDTSSNTDRHFRHWFCIAAANRLPLVGMDDAT